MELSWIASFEQDGQKLDQVLRGEYGLSRRQLVRLKRRQGSVLVNGHVVPVVIRLQFRDRIQIIMVEHLEPLPCAEIPLDIIYEDQDILILNKPAGLVSHPTKGYARGTLANALSWHWKLRGEGRPARLVTRLDRETSGLVLVAKSAWSHHHLSQVAIHKQYYAITRGIPNPLQGEIDLPIGLSLQNPNKRGVNPDGKSSLTRYKTEKSGHNLALVKLEPVTGRTHQLRIHMAQIGCPLLDDFMYGTQEDLLGRTALHAHSLSFVQPNTGKIMAFKADLPGDMANVLRGM